MQCCGAKEWALLGWQYLGTIGGPATWVTATDSLHGKHGVILDARKFVVNGYQCIKCEGIVVEV